MHFSAEVHEELRAKLEELVDLDSLEQENSVRTVNCADFFYNH